MNRGWGDVVQQRCNLYAGYWVLVRPVSRFFGQRMPHVKVVQKAIKPGPALEAWLGKTKASKRPGLFRVRHDLMPKDQQHGGLLKPYKFPRDKGLLETALKALREKLRCQGFTVDGVTDM